MKRLLLLLILCLVASSAYAQSGIALDAWKRSKDNMRSDGSNSASTTKLKGLELSGGLVGLDANFEMDATAEQGFLLASSADSVPDINGMLFVNHGAIWDGYPIYHSSQQSSFSLWYNTSESKWWISASPGSLSAGWESSTLEGTYTALSAVGSVAISWEPISIAGAFGEGASAYDLAESRMATDFSNADAGVNFVDDNEKSTIASLTLNMMTWSGSLASGATSLATTKKFDSGILFVGGLIYDLADATVVTLNQAGVNTVIEFASPIVGDKLCVLLILK